jgi:cell division protein FtsZ
MLLNSKRLNSSKQSTKKVRVSLDDDSNSKSIQNNSLESDKSIDNEQVIEFKLSKKLPTDQHQPPVDQDHNQLHTPKQNKSNEESLEERRERLKNLSIKLNNPEVLNELENKPAYLRKGVSLDHVDHSSDTNESKWVITDDDEPEIRDNNSFLHDNVD